MQCDDWATAQWVIAQSYSPVGLAFMQIIVQVQKN